MRHQAITARLVATVLILAAAPQLAAAQRQGCDEERQSCTAGCRAAYFTIDPRRETCTRACAAAAASCGKISASTCRAGSAGCRPGK